MRILILGGTIFLGRHLTEAALDAGCEVTLFNRGRSAPGLFSDRVETIVGDRGGDLAALRGRRFDAVIDTIREAPALVDGATRALSQVTERYVFISTVSVYRDFGAAVHDEDAPTAELPEREEDENYATLKVRSEDLVRSRYPDAHLVLRPGLIVGPHDPTDRFTWWVRRLRRGGDLLAPGHAGRPVQFLDARDLAAWTLRLIDERTGGTFNAVGPREPLTMGALIEALRPARSPTGRVCWVGESFPLEQGLAPYSELPLWLPEARFPHANEVDGARARAAGLRFRPPRETIEDIARWDRERGEPRLEAGLDPAREAELLRAWRRG